MQGPQGSVWDGVPQAPPDPILSIGEAFKLDKDPRRMNLGVGAYRTEDGKPLVLDCVKKAERAILADASANKEYLPITGNADFCRLSRELAFGQDSPAVREGRITTVQALSGTGSLRVGAEFLAAHYPVKTVLIPKPSWPTHRSVFKNAGLQVLEYRYFDTKTRGLDFAGLMSDVSSAEPGSILLLHACAHNPTGVDPTPEQWQALLNLAQRRRLLPFFDSAYQEPQRCWALTEAHGSSRRKPQSQFVRLLNRLLVWRGAESVTCRHFTLLHVRCRCQGFASGSLDRDATAIRMFANAPGMEMLLGQSYAKNMGLYGERVGALSIVCRSADGAKRVDGQLRLVIRPMYSNPPMHGAAIAAKILGDPQLCSEWKEELRGMADRINTMRTALFNALKERNAPGDWSFVLKQIGMFSYTGLTREQCENMTNKWHVYLTMDGRISMAGLSASRAGYLADAIIDSLKVTAKARL